MSTTQRTLRWAEFKGDFARDGALRDIYVENTVLQDWERLLAVVQDEYRYEFRCGDQTMALPTAEEALRLGRSLGCVLEVNGEGLRVVVHFFGEDEIEMTIDPAEIRQEADFNALLGWLERVGQALERDVLVTHENSKELPIFCYVAQTNQFRVGAGERDD